MTKFVLIGLCEPATPEGQSAFEEWFIGQHIEDTAHCPNFIKGSVFKLAGAHLDGKTVSRYLSLYEVEAPSYQEAEDVLNAWQKNPERYWRDAPAEVAEVLVNWITPFHEGREWLQRDEAMRSVGMAAQTIMLAAKSMGYESCPMIGFDQDAVAALINLPADHVIGMMIAVGKGTKPAWQKPGQLPLSEVLIQDRFSS